MLPVTKLHLRRVADQIQTNVINLQQDVRRNALQHKAWAEAQSVPRAQLVTMIGDCITQYQRRIQWVRDLFDGPRGDVLRAYLVALDWSEAEIRGLLNDIEAICATLRDAPRATYAQIAAACDVAIAAADPVPSLWPE